MFLVQRDLVLILFFVCPDWREGSKLIAAPISPTLIVQSGLEGGRSTTHRNLQAVICWILVGDPTYPYSSVAPSTAQTNRPSCHSFNY